MWKWFDQNHHIRKVCMSLKLVWEYNCYIKYKNQRLWIFIDIKNFINKKQISFI